MQKLLAPLGAIALSLVLTSPVKAEQYPEMSEIFADVVAQHLVDRSPESGRTWRLLTASQRSAVYGAVLGYCSDQYAGSTHLLAYARASDAIHGILSEAVDRPTRSDLAIRTTLLGKATFCRNL
jgi:hypothetical protein